jgi:AraC family transcriptional regulator
LAGARQIHSISPQSLQCAGVVPSLRKMSSRDLGWTSILIDLHIGVASNEPYTSVHTPDPRVGISISGRQSSEFFTKGKWRHDRHEPGCVTLHRVDDACRFRFPKPQDSDCVTALVYFPVEGLAEAAEHLRRPGQKAGVPHFAQIVGSDPAITQMARTMISAMNAAADDLYPQTVASWLSLHVLTFQGLHSGLDDRRKAGEISDGRLRRVMDYMSANFGQPLTLDDLASEACISKYHFTRLFKQRTGRTPYRVLTIIRLEAAARLLADSDTSISGVAAACGFRNVSHFTTAFGRHYGKSPSMARRDPRFLTTTSPQDTLSR